MTPNFIALIRCRFKRRTRVRTIASRRTIVRAPRYFGIGVFAVALSLGSSRPRCRPKDEATPAGIHTIDERVSRPNTKKARPAPELATRAVPYQFNGRYAGMTATISRVAGSTIRMLSPTTM
jgi:hypothetical protein